MSGDSGGPFRNDSLHLPPASFRIVTVLGLAGLFVLVAYLVGLWLLAFGVLRQAVLWGSIAVSLAGLCVLPWRPILRGVQRYFRFRLATLLLCVPVAGLVVGLIGRHQLDLRRERNAYLLAEGVLGVHNHHLVCSADGRDPYQRTQPWERQGCCLTFVGEGLTDDEMRKLSAMKNLYCLRLENTDVTEHGLMELRKLPSLRVLIVDTPRINDESF